MATQLETRSPSTHATDRRISGLALIALGLVLLLGRLAQDHMLPTLVLPLGVIRADALATLVVPAMGLIFLAWAAAARRFGLAIPGLILLGVGSAAVLLNGPLQGLRAEAVGGVIVTALALSFALIALASALLAHRLHLWPLIPATVLGMIGASLLRAEDSWPLLTLLGVAWPGVLIALGLILILRYVRSQR